MTKATLKTMKKRNKSWNAYRTLPSSVNYNQYKALRNKVCAQIKRDKARYQNSLIQNFRHRPKLFYGYMRNMQTVRSRIPNINKQDGTKTKTDQETASTLCEYFASTFVQEKDMEDEDSTADSDQLVIAVSEDLVLKTLSRLKPDKSPGPDNMHPMLLRETAHCITQPLTWILQKSVEEGILPDDWKRANITPIFKKGSKSAAENYRPISLTSCVCKVLETIIKVQMTAFLEARKQITNRQHGFVSGRSCLTNLLEVFEDWTRSLDERYGIDVIY